MSISSVSATGTAPIVVPVPAPIPAPVPNTDSVSTTQSVTPGTATGQGSTVAFAHPAGAAVLSGTTRTPQEQSEWEKSEAAQRAAGEAYEKARAAADRARANVPPLKPLSAEEVRAMLGIPQFKALSDNAVKSGSAPAATPVLPTTGIDLYS